MVKIKFSGDFQSGGVKNYHNCQRCKEYKYCHGHHVVKRSAMGEDGDVIYLCVDCHAFVEGNPAEAKQEGLWIPFYSSTQYNQKYKNVKEY